MSDFVGVFLPMMLYICGIILLIVLIVLGIKLIMILDKVDRVVDNVEQKVNSLNTAFSIIDRTTDGIIGIGNTIVSAITSLTNKLMKKNKFVEEEDDYE